MQVIGSRTRLCLATLSVLYHISTMSQASLLDACAVLTISMGQTDPTGQIHVDLSNVMGRQLPGKVMLRSKTADQAYFLKVSDGTAVADCPPGDYSAYIYVYDRGVPIVVDIRDITVEADGMASIPLTLTEGSGQLPLQSFDADLDLVLDRVEEEHGTDRFDPASMPGVTPLPDQNVVLKKSAGWYKGELHAHSSYGKGTETVASLVRRAEKARLDFLAITDLNTMAACQDPGFTSSSVVLIPAMKWGDTKRGYALVYGPRTFPERADTFAHAQAVMRRVQSQGGIFAIAHPCFRDAPWQWGLEYANAIEVWCRDWRSMPPVQLTDLDEDLQTRGEQRLGRDPKTALKVPGKYVEGKLIYPIAQAAATTHLAANAKAEIFWDAHLSSGMRVSPIAGSMASASAVTLGKPITYVYANEKSLNGILRGLRQGRTFVSSAPNGPTIDLYANVKLNNRTIFVPMGGMIPIGAEARLVVSVRNGKGKKVQIFADGHPIISKTMNSKKYDRRIDIMPDHFTVFRARVVEQAAISNPATAYEETGLGTLAVLALSSPIYAEPIDLTPPGAAPPEPTDDPAPELASIPVEERVKKAMEAVERIAEGKEERDWISIVPEGLPPIYATGVRTQDGKVSVTMDHSRPPQFFQEILDEEFLPSPRATVQEIQPRMIR